MHLNRENTNLQTLRQGDYTYFRKGVQLAHPFASKIIAHTAGGTVSSLKGVGAIKRLKA